MWRNINIKWNDYWNTTSYLESLPDELIYQICENLNNQDLAHLEQTHSRVYQICHQLTLKRKKEFDNFVDELYKYGGNFYKNHNDFIEYLKIKKIKSNLSKRPLILLIQSTIPKNKISLIRPFGFSENLINENGTIEYITEISELDKIAKFILKQNFQYR